MPNLSRDVIFRGPCKDFVAQCQCSPSNLVFKKLFSKRNKIFYLYLSENSNNRRDENIYFQKRIFQVATELKMRENIY